MGFEGQILKSLLYDKAQEIIARAQKINVTLATAESCTGGMVSAILTEIPGASAVFDRGFVTYSNQSKSQMLGVADETLAKYGAVSAQTACEMALGVLQSSKVDCAVSITGIAGPGGGTIEKPVGLVFFGYIKRGQPVKFLEKRFEASPREIIRLEATKQALDLLCLLLAN